LLLYGGRAVSTCLAGGQGRGFRLPSAVPLFLRFSLLPFLLRSLNAVYFYLRTSVICACTDAEGFARRARFTLRFAGRRSVLEHCTARRIHTFISPFWWREKVTPLVSICRALYTCLPPCCLCSSVLFSLNVSYLLWFAFLPACLLYSSLLALLFSVAWPVFSHAALCVTYMLEDLLSTAWTQHAGICTGRLCLHMACYCAYHQSYMSFPLFYFVEPAGLEVAA